ARKAQEQAATAQQQAQQALRAVEQRNAPLPNQAPNQGSTPAPNDQAVRQQQQQTTTGRVSSVGTTEIVLAQPGQPELHVRIDSNVPVTVDGQTASVNDIPNGANASVVIGQQDDQQVAKRIDATTRQPVRGTEGQQQQ